MDMNKGFPDESVRIQYEKLLLLAPISALIPPNPNRLILIIASPKDSVFTDAGYGDFLEYVSRCDGADRILRYFRWEVGVLVLLLDSLRRFKNMG